MEKPIQINRSPDLYEINPSLHDIEIGEWRIGRDTLATSGASTCIVLAAYNHQRKIGLLGHFTALVTKPGLLSNKDSFDEAVSQIPSLGEKVDTSIWIGGGSPYFSSGVDTVEQDRIYAMNALMKSGLPPDNLMVEWSKKDTAIDVELQSAAGKLAIHSYKSFRI